MDDAQAWMRALWVEHSADIYHFVHRRVPELAEDVTSETFLTAWRRREDVPAEPRAWLFVTARNVLLTQSRGRTRHDQLLVRAATLAEEDRVESDVAEQVTERAAERFAWLSLSPNDREVLMLVGWDGLSNAEAAAVLGCTPATFAVRLYRARRHLLRARASSPDYPITPRPEGVPNVS
ncbi:RNA polymerase sigma factor [Miniimonas sp. S16]|uniref:RNA polymerase sigma factor n=1 Tax=Miniimonas sp. S16 TaxID=2171623 RepID=UPI000D52724B|nr:RNA polymerase sigma factor [Miniimonas sp. S16]